MKKIFILLLLTQSFQGFLLAQDSNDQISKRENPHVASSKNSDQGDDLDAMLDGEDTQMGDIKPVATPQKNKINYLAVYYYSRGGLIDRGYFHSSPFTERALRAL